MEKAKNAISNTRFDNRRTWSLLKSEDYEHDTKIDLPAIQRTRQREQRNTSQKIPKIGPKTPTQPMGKFTLRNSCKNSNSSALFCKKKSWIKLACLICIILAYWNWNWNHLTAGRQTNGFVLVRSVCKSFRSSLSQASGRTAYDNLVPVLIIINCYDWWLKRGS